MRVSRRGKIIFFLTFGVVLAAIAVAVGFGWIILNWRQEIRVFLGIIFFGAIATGLILNTSFLVREIRRNEQHDSFINAVTHELKTPIASIRLHLQTLERQQMHMDDAQRRDFYHLMLEDTDRLMSTVEKVLKAGQAAAKGQTVSVDFAQLVEDCVESARTSHHLQPSALRYQSSLNGSDSEVNGDPEDLRTAVSNILDNAVKYSGNHVDVSVQLALEEQKRLVLRVQDRGVGIPRSELKTIFKRFYRVPRAFSQVRGTGLGLFLVRTIAKRHGGRVLAESAGEGKGATVILELPRRVS
ncbi:MAG: Two-component sensor histidine kinase [Acidobacteriaceae bacterium]|nr:Two-component sensor histidine kinase [Acidobacteriaceae bacterium]